MLFNCFIPFFIIIVHHFLFPILYAIPSVDDNMLIAFMKGHQETKLSEYSMEKNEAHLGIMHYMRMNWKCDKIAKEFEEKEYERTECQKYRKYLEILYEYLCREYAGIPTVKPKFVLKKEFEIEGPIIYAVNCLVKILQFYFIQSEGQFYDYKLNELFYKHFEPILLNEKRLNYEFKLKNESKLPINEMILQLAIETANEWQTNENLDGIIKQKFEENLEKMLKKAEQKAKKDKPLKANHIIYNIHLIIVYSKFDDQRTWTEDVLFLEFVKGLATNSDKFIRMVNEYTNYLSQKTEEGIIYAVEGHMITFGLDEIGKMKEDLTHEYEYYLGLMYLMNKNWNCEKIWMEFEKKELTECQKYRKFLDILYEYLFRLYAEAKNPMVSKQLPPLVKPIFIGKIYLQNLIEVVEKLDEISIYIFEKRNSFIIFIGLDLLNEDEFNYEMKEKVEEKSPKNEMETKIDQLHKELNEKWEKYVQVVILWKRKSNPSFSIE